MSDNRRNLPPQGMGRMNRGRVVEKPKNMKGTLRRLWDLTRGHRNGLMWILLLSGLSSGAAVLSPYVTGRAITAISQGDAVTLILLALAALYLCDWLIKFLQSFFMASIGQRVIHHIRSTLFAHIRNLPPQLL